MKENEKVKNLQISGDNYPQNEYRIFADFLPLFFVLSTVECDGFYLQIFANS